MKLLQNLVAALACILLPLSYSGRCAAADDDQIVLEHNITYGKAGDTELKLELARPQGDGPFPAIVFIHGGGWYQGNRQSHHR
jgi:acetyl esterase/lipase